MRLLLFFMFSVSCIALATTTVDNREQLETELLSAGAERKISILQQLVKDYSKQDPPYALQQATTLVSLLETSGQPGAAYLDALRQLATLQVGQGLLVEATGNVEKLASGALKLADYNSQIQALKIQGVIQRIQSNYVGALTHFQQASDIAKQQEMPDAALQIDYEIAIIYYYMGKYAEAIELLRHIQSRVADNNPLMQAKTLNILGIVYANQSRFEDSLEVMLTALQIQKSLNNKGAQQALLNNIGVTYNRIGKLKQALDIYVESLNLAVAIKDVQSEALALLNIAAIEQDLGDFESAHRNLTRGMAIAEQLNDKNMLALGINSQADYFLYKADFEQVIALSQRAMALADDTGDTTTAVKPRQNLAKAYLAQGDFAKAQDCIEQAIAIATELGNKSNLSKLYKLQADIYEQGGLFAKALAAHKHYSDLNNDVFNSESDKKMSALRAKNESLQKDRVIESLAAEQQLAALQHEKALALKDSQAAQEQFRRNIFIAMSALLLCVMFLIYRRRLQTRLNRTLKQLVKDRTRELAAKNIELERAYAVLETQSLTDPLTNLHNRRFLMQKLPADLHQINSNSDEADFVFLLLDLDNFKQVNDTYGHTAGDLILIQFSELMQQVFRSSDYLIRWGGEEFLVVMRHMRRENAPAYAERLRQTVQQHAFVINEALHINMTCSIGFASYNNAATADSALSWNQVIDIADICLYAAKRSRKNAWVGINDLAPQLMFNDLAADMAHAVETKQLTIVASIAAAEIIWS